MIYLSLFLLSATVLALEITWMRMLGLQQWAHVASVVISLALLGFAASGTWIALVRKRMERSWRSLYSLGSFVYSVSIPFVFMVQQQIPLDPFRLLWDFKQGALLLFSCLLLFIPFFFGAACIGMLFCVKEASIPRVYFANLCGSGFGVSAALWLLTFLSTKGTLGCIVAVGFGSFLLSLDKTTAKVQRPVLFGAVLGLCVFGMSKTSARISPHKPLEKVRHLPGVRVVEAKGSPWGDLHILKGPSLRSLPGLSLRYGEAIPAGEMIFLDGDSVGCRVSAETAVEHALDFFDFTLPSLPYAITHGPHVLVLGAGSGMGALRALYLGAERISLVEPHPLLFQTQRAWLRRVQQQRFSRRELRLDPAEARGFVRSSQERFDLIVIDRLGSPSAAFTGAQAFRGDYLLTIEGLEDLFDHLREQGGMLAVTSWLHLPPRDNVKLFASFVEVLHRKETPHANRHLFAARSWSACTILLSRSAFDPKDVAALRDFCSDRDFDPITFPGMDPRVANQKNVLEQPYYRNAMTRLLADGVDAYGQGYVFNVSPASDDRPFFQNFVKWTYVRRLWKEMGGDWVFLREWGYFALWITFVCSVVLGALVVLVPLVLRRTSRDSSRDGRRPAGGDAHLLLFAFLGSGFLFYEIVFVEIFTLCVSFPMLSVGLVLSAILIWSSLGGLATGGWAGQESTKRLLLGGCFLTAASGGVYAVGLPAVMGTVLGQSLSVRILFACLALVPPCVLMGIPFPSAMGLVRRCWPTDVAYCWGMNGWAAVMSAALAPVLSIHLGMRATLLLGACVYLLAGILSVRVLARSSEC